MARIPIQNVKSNFETGDRPTQQHYADLIDTLSSQSTDLGTFGNNESVITGIDTTTVVDSVQLAVWRTVKYVVQISHPSTNKYKITELSIIIDGDNAHTTEYGIVTNHEGNLASVSTDINDDIMNLVVTPTISPVTVRFYRTGLKV